MLSQYLEHLNQIDKKLKREGINLALNLSVDGVHINEQVTILEQFLYFNRVLGVCDSIHKIPSLLNFDELGLTEFMRRQISEEYESEWNKKLAELTAQPEDAGKIDSEVKIISGQEVKLFTEALNLTPSIVDKFRNFSETSDLGVEFDEDDEDEDEDDFEYYEDENILTDSENSIEFSDEFENSDNLVQSSGYEFEEDDEEDDDEDFIEETEFENDDEEEFEDDYPDELEFDDDSIEDEEDTDYPDESDFEEDDDDYPDESEFDDDEDYPDESEFEEDEDDFPDETDFDEDDEYPDEEDFEEDDDFVDEYDESLEDSEDYDEDDDIFETDDDYDDYEYDSSDSSEDDEDEDEDDFPDETDFNEANNDDSEDEDEDDDYYDEYSEESVSEMEDMPFNGVSNNQQTVHQQRKPRVEDTVAVNLQNSINAGLTKLFNKNRY